jgi:hypothetical protein
VGDIAVLGSPDNQELGEQAEAYEELVEAPTPLSIGAAVAWDAPTPASLVALDGSSILGSARRFASSSSFGPAARWMAPSTPPPPRSDAPTCCGSRKDEPADCPRYVGIAGADQHGAAIGIVTLTWNDKKLGTTDGASTRLLLVTPPPTPPGWCRGSARRDAVWARWGSERMGKRRPVVEPVARSSRKQHQEATLASRRAAH